MLDLNLVDTYLQADLKLDCYYLSYILECLNLQKFQKVYFLNLFLQIKQAR